VLAGHDPPATVGSRGLDEVVVEPPGRGQAGLAARSAQGPGPFPAAASVLAPFGRGGCGVDRAVLDDHSVDSARAAWALTLFSCTSRATVSGSRVRGSRNRRRPAKVIVNTSPGAR
jgi:hypothetical protein